jgi:D-alanyl-D-alanine carboxypeptidase/D-alanyl-D-alanine-endopeptidase (penicillin-binding protein 4)
MLKAVLPVDGSDTSGFISMYPKIKNALFLNRIKKDSLKKTEIDVNEETELGKNAKFVLIGSIKKVKDTASLELAQPNPALTISYLLCDYLKQIHVEVETNVGLVYELPKTLNAIDSTPSPTVAQLVRFTNHQSNNLFAECLLRMAAQKSGYMDKDLGKFLIDYWSSKGIKMNGSTVIDGSGLSRMDAISPQQIVELLKWMGESENKDIFKNSLPIAGVSGTLKHFCKGTAGENRIFAKTGSATGIQCYSGYIETKAGRKLIFSLLINQFSGQRSSMRHKLEGFFNQIIKN